MSRKPSQHFSYSQATRGVITNGGGMQWRVSVFRPLLWRKILEIILRWEGDQTIIVMECAMVWNICAFTVSTEITEAEWKRWFYICITLFGIARLGEQTYTDIWKHLARYVEKYFLTYTTIHLLWTVPAQLTAASSIPTCDAWIYNASWTHAGTKYNMLGTAPWNDAILSH